MAQGKKDVTKDLERRTNVKKTDALVLVNKDTDAVQEVLIEDLGSAITFPPIPLPTPSNETFVIV